MRTLAMPKAAEPWSLTSLRELPDGRGRGATKMFQEILSLIARLRAPPAPA
jgi:hypothetical protein